jgi:hypothetical protein
MNYYEKYLKYKHKFITFKEQKGGDKKKRKKNIPIEYKKIKSNTVYTKQDYTNYATNINNHIKEYIYNDNLLPYYDINDVPDTLNYDDTHTIKNENNCHLGQRKLLLTEIEFYNKCIELNKENNIVIYGGSASCEHLPIILEMFPKLKFILVYPNYHSIDYKYKYIYQNVNAISPDNNKLFNKYSKAPDERNKHLAYLNKGLINALFMYDSNKTYNVLDLTQ